MGAIIILVILMVIITILFDESTARNLVAIITLAAIMFATNYAIDMAVNTEDIEEVGKYNVEISNNEPITISRNNKKISVTYLKEENNKYRYASFNSPLSLINLIESETEYIKKIEYRSNNKLLNFIFFPCNYTGYEIGISKSRFKEISA